MLEIRRNTRRLVDRLLRGESFTITYRNRAVGELRPVVVESSSFAGDPVYQIAERAEDLGPTLEAREADAILYGTPVTSHERT